MESVRSSVIPGDTTLYYQDELSVQDKVMLRRARAWSLNGCSLELPQALRLRALQYHTA